MMNIIYGVNGSDIDKQMRQRIIEKTEKKETVWLLVPEQFSLSAEKSVIMDFGIHMQRYIKVITFKRLSNLVLNHLGPLRMKYIDGAGKQIIAAKLLTTLSKKLSYLTPSIKKRGFSDTIVSLISEFKRYGVSYADLEEVSLKTKDDELKRKLSDLAVIYESFSEKLEESMADAEDNLAIILPKIKDCDFLKGSLFITHFRSFTPLEHSVIKELLRHMQVYTFLILDDINLPSSLFKATAKTAELLLSDVEKGEIFACKNIDNLDEISAFANNYFKNRPKEFQTDKIKIIEARDNYKEVEIAANLILKLSKEEGRKFSDFLILARDTEAYSRIMPSVFEKCSIDVFLDNRRSILKNPVSELICAFLDILSNGYSLERVMTALRTKMLGIENTSIDIFENYLLAVNPTHTMWNEKEWKWENGYDLSIINSVKQRLDEFLDTIFISGRKTAGDIVDALMTALKKHNILDRVKDMTAEFEENNMPYLAKEYKQVWNGIISIFSQIVAIMGDENITYADFLELFKNSCAGISVSLTPQTQGSAVFSDIDKFRAEKVPIVIVLGVNEGVFPKGHTREGILSDVERQELLKLGLKLAPGADFKKHEEQMLIYSVLSCARDRLYLVTPLMTNDGKKLEESTIIKRIKKINKNVEIFNPDLLENPLSFVHSKAEAFEILCGAISAIKGNIDKLSQGYKKLYDYFEKDELYKEKLSKIVCAIASKDNEKISEKMAEELYGKTLMLSASKIEKYNACAFSYFLNYGLFINEREKAGIEPRSTGTIQHAALYEYFSQLEKEKKDYKNITKESCYERIYEIVKSEAIKSSELLYESSSYYKYVVTRMQGIAARTAWEVIKFYRSSDFRPKGFEITIKTGGEIPAIYIENEKGDKIAGVRGVVDRADTAVIDGKTYVSIVDYKSSQKKLDERLAKAGVHIQPLLYADIVSKRMNASPAAMLYMQMTDPIVEESRLKNMEDSLEKNISQAVALDGWIVDNPLVVSAYSRGGENGEKFIPSGKSDMISEKELKIRIDAANEKIRETALNIKSGFFPIKPYIENGFNPCSYCIYDKICEQKSN